MIKLHGNEGLYLKRFTAPSRRMSEAILTSTISGRMPKYIVEAVAMGGIILLSLVLLMRQAGAGSSGSSLLPMLGLYGFCGYRMLPAIQGIYLAVTQIRFGSEALKHVAAEVEGAKSGEEDQTSLVAKMAPMAFNRAIKFEHVYYSYPGSEAHGIADFSLTIPHGSSTGIVGATGAGKTTFIDLFLGLLPPTAGRITCDGVELSEANLPAWRANVGYVPQEILLTSSSIKENIAFGVNANEIDMERVTECAKVAQIHEFILGELPEGYETSVGERGIRLSGGQRQRVGIARAMYADPAVLVLDEATSALDTETESNVMAGIREMGKSKTILIVAHRYSTLETCDQVVQLKNGRLARVGDFGSILAGADGLKEVASSGES